MERRIQESSAPPYPKYHWFVQESYLREQIKKPSGKKFLDLYGYGMTLNDFRNNRRIPKLSWRLLERDITCLLSLKDT